MHTLLYATTNKYKLGYAVLALKPYCIQVNGIAEDIPDVHEIQSDSQQDVAVDKAKKYFEVLGTPLIVMDFGFFMEGLKGFPGVYTKYTIDTIGTEGLITLAKSIENKRAYTQRTIVYVDAQQTKVFSSKCPGSIVTEPRGTNGRDYDFIFRVDETGKTLAEMSDEERVKITSRAWDELAGWLKSAGYAVY